MFIAEVRHQLRLCRPKYVYTVSSLASIAREATSGFDYPVSIPYAGIYICVGARV